MSEEKKETAKKEGIKKMNFGMLVGAKAAEEALARNEMVRLRDSLPEGHPLRVAAEEIGDGIASLPKGHPLRVAMEQARERYEVKASEAAETAEVAPPQPEPDKAQELKKAKKLEQEQRKERIAKEIASEEECRKVADVVNEGIGTVLGALRPLYKVLAESDAAFAGNQYCQIKAMKLKRLLVAVERAIFDCRMKV